MAVAEIHKDPATAALARQLEELEDWRANAIKQLAEEREQFAKQEQHIEELTERIASYRAALEKLNGGY